MSRYSGIAYSDIYLPRADQPSGFYWPGLADWSSFLALDEVMAFWDLVGMDPARTYCNYLVRDAAP